MKPLSELEGSRARGLAGILFDLDDTFLDAGILTGFNGKSDFSSLLGYTYCPAGGTLLTQPSCLGRAGNAGHSMTSSACDSRI